MELTEGFTVVRHWRPADAEPLVVQANDRRVWLGLRDAFPHPYGIGDARRFLMTVREMSPRTFFAIEEAGAVAGGIGYTLGSDVERVGAEIGYWVGHEFWGRGVATRALRLTTGHAFRTHPELRRLFAVPFATNPASARVLEKAGYRYEGTLRHSALKAGQILDQWIYSILRIEVLG